MQTKRILCLIDGLGSGGAERQMIGLVLCLKRKGYEVDLVKYHQLNDYGELLKRYGMDVVTLAPKSSAISKLQTIKRFIKSRSGYECLIAYKNGPAMIGCLLKLIGGKFRLIVSERYTSQRLSANERLKFCLYRLADYIVPNSFSQEGFIKKYYPGLAGRTVTITNYTDTDMFVPGIGEPDESVVQVLTVARIVRQKNVLRYLEAISLLVGRGVNNAHFDWYGGAQKGQEEYYRAVNDKVVELGLQKFVTFHPVTDNVVEKYQKCSFFCLPSNFEGFPNVICEAMSCGKPVLCSRVCDNPYIVKDGENGLFFDNTDVRDMADKLQHMIGLSPETLCGWGKKSREIAEALFSMQTFVDKYINLIEK